VTSDESTTNVKIAVVQSASVPFDAEASVEKPVRLIGEAAATGAEVIVFPEAFITGYPKGLNFGLVVGARDTIGREEFRLYLDQAIDVPGPLTLQLGKAAAAHGGYVIVGAIKAPVSKWNQPGAE
jgi:nitrilase